MEEASRLEIARADFLRRTVRAAERKAPSRPASPERVAEDAHEVVAEVDRVVTLYRELELDRDRWKARAEAAEKQIEQIRAERTLNR